MLTEIVELRQPLPAPTSKLQGFSKVPEPRYEWTVRSIVLE